MSLAQVFLRLFRQAPLKNQAQAPIWALKSFHQGVWVRDEGCLSEHGRFSDMEGWAGGRGEKPKIH